MSNAPTEAEAAICERGHTITRFSRHGGSPFCPECGKPAITTCANCNSYIPGGDPLYDMHWEPPNHCGQCGTMFPWAAKRVKDAEDLIDLLDGLSDGERSALKGTLDDLMTDSAATEVAAMRFKLLAKKVGSEGGAALRSIVTSVATEAAKRAILGP